MIVRENDLTVDSWATLLPSWGDQLQDLRLIPIQRFAQMKKKRDRYKLEAFMNPGWALYAQCKLQYITQFLFLAVVR